ncbi:hypothetical protein GGE07_005371 [Sinorhizobium terangae]|uniref:Prolyl 4-hydroxylase alpha subunit Fe(2+) 2OG dioxygenase domain-containing protein n=1 Tax=Sinorhizobium terangae TaxID=110322 RepID=A0A6N7LLV0_SINTE|nr:2OG-Fe(II) oxygenase [Sinorhizobium terangae]MBB4188692.1 hypothetical protein [Sinorhizobium terangae]MQX18853.1 hypothetical protein [Sinorhizobium terangae]
MIEVRASAAGAPIANGYIQLDTNPVTGLLFAETLGENEGGALVFNKNGEEFRIQPQRGMFYCFDARDVPHAVEPLRGFFKWAHCDKKAV